jgi:hypothetical protein
MEKEVRRLKKIHLALAVARGQSIDAWAKKDPATVKNPDPRRV